MKSTEHPVQSDMLRDRYGRALGSLRISVTDRCNIRCGYCMPEESYVWLPRESLLSYEEIRRVAGIFGELGVRKLRITGGEPLMRQDLPELVRMLSPLEPISDLALTTNGILLARSAAQLREAGLDRITVSLDTLKPDRYADMTRSKRLPQALEGIDAAREAGFGSIKLNSVVIKGRNDDEVIDLLEYAAREQLEVRFIEYMDVGGATAWRPEEVFTKDEILASIEEQYGTIEPLPNPDGAPADRFVLPHGQVFGIIASTTAPFCGSCDRSRLTADGHWLLCLYATRGTDLRELLRSGADDEELKAVVRRVWAARMDRGAEERLAVPDRAALYQIGSLKRNPHLEMHTRGG